MLLWVPLAMYAKNDTQKKLLREWFLMQEVTVPPTSVFIGHGSVQPTDPEWCKEYCTRYHSYLIPTNPDLLDALASACSESISFG